MLDIEHGIALFFIGMTITIVGFTIAYSIANYYYKKEQSKKNRPHNPVYDLFKDMPGHKLGEKDE